MSTTKLDVKLFIKAASVEDLAELRPPRREGRVSAPSQEEPRLGCRAFELEVGTEFSMDEGRTWLVVRTEPKYVSDAPECDDLYFMASPAETTSLSAWERVQVSDRRHVLLERHWPGNKKES